MCANHLIVHTSHSAVISRQLTVLANVCRSPQYTCLVLAGQFSIGWCVQVTLVYTAPTAIRALQSFGNEWVTKHSRASLRILGTVGEPINPEAWKWYHEVRSFAPLHNRKLSGGFPAGKEQLHWSSVWVWHALQQSYHLTINGLFLELQGHQFCKA